MIAGIDRLSWPESQEYASLLSTGADFHLLFFVSFCVRSGIHDCARWRGRAAERGRHGV